MLAMGYGVVNDQNPKIKISYVHRRNQQKCVCKGCRTIVRLQNCKHKIAHLKAHSSFPSGGLNFQDPLTRYINEAIRISESTELIQFNSKSEGGGPFFTIQSSKPYQRQPYRDNRVLTYCITILLHLYQHDQVCLNSKYIDETHNQTQDQ